jgi:exopolysaccharide biosynthesis polyprenyl glycosylphosphotransferase
MIWNSRSFRLLRFAVDGVLVAVAWMGAYVLRLALNDYFPRPINPPASYIWALPIIVCLWLVSCHFFGIYRRSRSKGSIERVQDLLKSIVLGLLLACTVSFWLKGWQLGRAVVLLSACFNLLLLSMSWWFFGRWEKRRSLAQVGLRKALILGTGESALRVSQRIEDDPEHRYQVVGYLAVDTDEPDEHATSSVILVDSSAILGHMDQITTYLVESGADEVFVACPEVESTRIFAMISECEGIGATFWMVTDAFQVLSQMGPSNTIGSLPLVQLSGESPSFLYDWSKRLFDVAVASIVLLLTLPMWLYWALRIKLDSKGSVFFTQERCGHHGETFTIYKFRTMSQESNPYEEAPREKGDARVTAYGQWLRRTSIDELPQLFNVLKGDMSLVGPRPEMPFIVETYQPWQRCRLAVKPGLTGLWQILGRKDLPMHDNLQYDFYYMRNRSLALDLSILIRTAFVVFGGKGAF